MLGSVLVAAVPTTPVDAVVESVDGGEVSTDVVASADDPLEDPLDESSLDPVAEPDESAIDAPLVSTSGGVPKHPVNSNTAILRTSS